MSPSLEEIELATFVILEGPGSGEDPFTVQFNPASLEYTLSNEFDSSGGNNASRQFVKKTSGKLSMTLMFDTTDTGGDVREVTANMAALLKPGKDGKKKFAPKVEFSWGSFSFKGVVEQYKETIDFFAASGVPLRSSISLTLSSQEVEFQSNKSPAPAVDRKPPEPVSVPGAMAPSAAAGLLGDPRAARAIASASGSVSLRFGAEGGLSVGAEVSLAGPADFSAGASLGIGGGLSLGGGIGVSATAGASFAGLRVAPAATGVSVGEARAVLLPAPAATGAASFGPGGRARIQNGASLSADVTGSGSLAGRIGFGD